MFKHKTVVITSGGMDSTTAVYYTLDTFEDSNPLLLSFDYGQRHLKELECASLTASILGLDHRIINLRSLKQLLQGSALTDDSVPVPEGHYAEETMKATVVPNRNAIMLNIAIGAAVACAADGVVTGVHAGDHAVYPDCRPKFIDKLNELALVANEGFINPHFRVLAPFINIDKAEIARIGARLGVQWRDTWSCYKGGAIHCGRCSTCVERLEAFAEAGVEDNTPYEDEHYWRTVIYPQQEG